MAAKGISLHIGLNKVNPSHYNGWDGELIACEADAIDMAALADDIGYTTKIIFTKDATRKAVIKEISDISKKLKSGDIFFLTYSGHGGQLPDRNGDERDFEDETWVLFDGQIVDDELYTLYSKFSEGVRIVVLSDSCHSGSVTKTRYYERSSISGILSNPKRFRAMPASIAFRTYQANKAFYDKILKDQSIKENNPDSKNYKATLKATVRLISGCQDNQLSSDGDFNGLFTGTLLEVWRSGNFRGSYRQLRKEIGRLMPPDQTPNHFLIGKRNARFDTEQAFSI
jgi:metacaspase-1